MTPNTQITPETVGMLKAGDWLIRRGERLVQFTGTWTTGRGTQGIKHQGGSDYAHCFTYIGPDLGDGWIGWSGGENPVPGMRVEIRYEDGTEDNAEASETAPWRSTLPRIIAFRRAAPSPSAVGVGEISQGQRAFEAMRDHGDQSLIAGKSRKAWSDLTDAEQKQWQDDATERPSLYRATPTPAPSAGDAAVDWEVVGPRLVEALEAIKAGGSWQGDTASDALAAATPRGK